MRRFLTRFGSHCAVRKPAATKRAVLNSLTAASFVALVSACSGGGSTSTKADPYLVGVLPAAEQVAKANTVGHWIKQGDDTLSFTGLVAAGAAAELAANLTPKITTLTVTSNGGDLAEGVAVGQAISDHKLALVINGACIGPCADYWFPATKVRAAKSGSWLGYVPDLAQSGNADPAALAAEVKLYTAIGLDSAKFHAALASELRQLPGSEAPAQVAVWMPNKADLSALGYSADELSHLWLPPNLASANAQARAWGHVVAYRNTLVGVAATPAALTSPAAASTATSGGAHA